MLLATKADSPLDTVAKVVAYAKANPGKLNFGTIATGSTQHLSAELFKLATGVQAPIVIYKTTPDLVTAILRGDVDVGFDYYAAFGPVDRHKQFKVIATSGEHESSAVPGVPTVKESGYPDFVVTSWNAIQGPAGVPKDIVTKLNEQIVAALKMPGNPGAHGRTRHGADDRLAGIPGRAHEERDRQMGRKSSRRPAFQSNSRVEERF